MAKIVKFPARNTGTAEVRRPAAKANTTPPAEHSNVLVKALWVITVLCWPLIKWVVTIDCLFQFVRMLYYWYAPGTYAGYQFLLHFLMLSALTYYVACYKPKGL